MLETALRALSTACPSRAEFCSGKPSGQRPPSCPRLNPLLPIPLFWGREGSQPSFCSMPHLCEHGVACFVAERRAGAGDAVAHNQRRRRQRQHARDGGGGQRCWVCSQRVDRVLEQEGDLGGGGWGIEGSRQWMHGRCMHPQRAPANAAQHAQRSTCDAHVARSAAPRSQAAPAYLHVQQLRSHEEAQRNGDAPPPPPLVLWENIPVGAKRWVGGCEDPIGRAETGSSGRQGTAGGGGGARRRARRRAAPSPVAGPADPLRSPPATSPLQRTAAAGKHDTLALHSLHRLFKNLHVSHELATLLNAAAHPAAAAGRRRRCRLRRAGRSAAAAAAAAAA